MDESQAGTSSKVFYTPIIDTSGFWKINSMSAVVNGQVISRDGNSAIADTGTTLCLVDKSLCESIYAQIPGSKFSLLSQGLTTDTTVATPDISSPSAILRRVCPRSLLVLVILTAMGNRDLISCLVIWLLPRLVQGTSLMS